MPERTPEDSAALRLLQDHAPLLFNPMVESLAPIELAVRSSTHVLEGTYRRQDAPDAPVQLTITYFIEDPFSSFGVFRVQWDDQCREHRPTSPEDVGEFLASVHAGEFAPLRYDPAIDPGQHAPNVPADLAFGRLLPGDFD
jgi:hypothetical protein